MKRFSEQNYYELLEVSYNATWGEIKKAYRLAKQTYSQDSIAPYSLFDANEREMILNRIEEAYETLIDGEKRKQYNLDILKGSPELDDQTFNDTGGLTSDQTDEEVLLSGPISGEALKRVREKRGVSLEEIADLTKISLAYLQFLEMDHYKRLPVEVYLQSYLNQYAAILKLDSARVVEGYLENYRKWSDENE
ncbi:MAG: helix-turn-helix domain-containing protein [Nitrospiria bacterium]